MEKVTDLKSLSSEDLWVFGECFQGKVHHGSLEILTPLKEVAKVLDKKLIFVCLCCEEEKESVISQVETCIADEVWIIAREELRGLKEDLYANVLVKLIEVLKPTGLFFPATKLGISVAPRIAGVLKLGLCAHVTNIGIEDGKIIMERPTYGENIIAKLYSETTPVMATISSGIYPIKTSENSPKFKLLELEGIDWSSKIKVRKFIPAKKQPNRLKDAKVVVAGGRGLKSKENFQKLFKLAELLKGEVGATRPVCYEGWVEEDRMIGVSGVSVHPKVYIGFGISGALQHTVGMQTSEYIIAVNTDKEAPLVKMANLALIGDASKVIDALIKKLESA